MTKEKILIIGSGGREHAIGWKLSQSKQKPELYFAPGNGGTIELGVNVPIKATDISSLIDFVKREKITLTLAIPDDPLALGIVDEFRKNNLRIWGPTRGAAQLESSKAFSKRFMQKYNLPTAKFEVFTDFDKAKAYLNSQDFPVVIKASGLALGKGVIIAENKDQARDALYNMLVKKAYGEAGDEVVIEEFLFGPEISIHAFSDGISYKVFPSSQDHKRAGENDTGPNTGGMGTIAPLPFVTKELMDRIEKEIIAPTLHAMKEEGIPYEGVLYPGLILTKDGPKILEYNARFGDPETQVYMRILETDLLEIIEACMNKKLADINIIWKNISACNIVLASGGYPESYEKGKVISGIKDAEQEKNIVVFHSGTISKDGKLLTNGGRVLAVCAIGNDIQSVLDSAYRAISKISFGDMEYRKDIGKKVLKLIE